MSVKNQIVAVALESLAEDINLLPRIVAEIERTNAFAPAATGSEKKARVVANLKVIFDDVATDILEPAATAVLNLLIEIGVNYVNVQAAKAASK